MSSENVKYDALLSINRAGERLKQYPDKMVEGLRLIAEVAMNVAETDDDNVAEAELQRLEEFVTSLQK